MSAGTLLLGGSERISDASTLTLGGGTFSLEGLHGATETLASLTLSAHSTLDFGTGSYASDLGNTL